MGNNPIIVSVNAFHRCPPCVGVFYLSSPEGAVRAFPQLTLPCGMSLPDGPNRPCVSYNVCYISAGGTERRADDRRRSTDCRRHHGQTGHTAGRPHHWSLHGYVGQGLTCWNIIDFCIVLFYSCDIVIRTPSRKHTSACIRTYSNVQFMNIFFFAVLANPLFGPGLSLL